jgi:glyoxylase-like metal-dependent hydrolase (beta-lactamase superfamily II)
MSMDWTGRAAAAVCCAALMTVGGEALAQARDSGLYQATSYKGREIGNLTGDVYYARMDDYVSAFLVTSEGIVLVEPIGTEFATWLKGELDSRFGVPVKYVVYSHGDADHASGAAVYADTARLIGHEAMLERFDMPPAATPLPAAASGQDANGNGRLERSEAQDRLAGLFDLYDVDEDGVLTGAEVVRGPMKYITPPDLTYRDPITIHLGGKRVEVIPMPNAHAKDNTIVRFVDGTNVVFASDWITNGRVPFGPDVTQPTEIEKIREVAAMDFEHFVCSHGRLGTKEDVTANLAYREAVRDAVAEAIAAGKTLEQARDTVLMEDYADWEFYAQQRPLNVAGAYRLLTAD